MLVWVLKPKNFILPAFFISAAQSLKAGIMSSMLADAVDEEQIHVIRCSLFRPLSRRFGEVVGLGYGGAW